MTYDESMRFNLTREQKEKLDKLADVLGKNKSDIVREGIWEVIENANETVDAELAELRQERDEIEDRIEQKRREISELESELADLNERIDELSEKSDEFDVEADYDAVVEQIATMLKNNPQRTLVPQHSEVKDTAKSHGKDVTTVIRHVFERHPDLHESRFVNVDTSDWSREFGDFAHAADVYAERVETDDLVDEIVAQFDHEMVSESDYADDMFVSDDVRVHDTVAQHHPDVAHTIRWKADSLEDMKNHF